MNESTVKCRICWEDKETSICVTVTTKWAKDTVKTIKDVVLLCVPWMSIKEDSHLCKPCLWQLKFTYDFIDRCVRTENILNEEHKINAEKIRLEDILEKSLKSGNKIQIIFENPASSPTDGTDDIDVGDFGEPIQENDEDINNINFKMHTPEVPDSSEHDYCIKKGSRINVDISKGRQNNEESIVKLLVSDKVPNHTLSEESNVSFNKHEKENIFNINDGNLSNDDDDFLIDLDTEYTNVKNTSNSGENNILQNKKKKLRTLKSVSKNHDLTQTSNPPQPKNELTELLDISAVNIWFMVARSEVSAEQQSDLVRDGVNILNMSNDPNKKKRTIYLSRDLCPGYFRCCKCNVAFLSRCEFLDHDQLHRKRKIKTPGAPNYTCKVCSETFTLDIDFRTHSKFTHGIGSPHACTKCNRRFKTKKMLNDHDKQFKNQDKCVYKCAQCNREYLFKHLLEQHEADVKDAPCCNYKKCKVCFEKFTKEDFKIHCMQVHSNFLCQECGKSYATSESLSAHRTNVHKQKICMCHECGKILCNPKYLEHHIQSVHGEKIYMCDKCPRQFTCQTYLQKHSNVHLEATLKEKRKCRCDKCGKVYAQRETLKEHEKMVHLGMSKYKCSICNEGFARNDYLKRHVKYHERYSANTCSVCKKSFGYQWRLESHIFSGHDENGKSLEFGINRPSREKRKYKSKASSYRCVCKICNKVLANKPTLNLHYRAHLRLRQRHKCDMCGIILQTRMALTNHLKLHKDPNFKFSCNICHAYKSSSIELERHINKVHKNKKYKCSLCHEAFGRKHLLLSHEATIHTEENHKKEALLEMLQADQILVSADSNMKHGIRTSKGRKLGNLEVDLDTVYKRFIENKQSLDDVPGVCHQVTTTPGSYYENFPRNQIPSHVPTGENVIVTENGYQSIEDVRACRILEEENRLHNLYKL